VTVDIAIATIDSDVCSHVIGYVKQVFNVLRLLLRLGVVWVSMVLFLVGNFDRARSVEEL